MRKFLSNIPKPFDIATAVNPLVARQSGIDVSLASSSTTTTIEDDRIGVDSMIFLMPTTADAAAENIYFTVTHGQVVLTHASNTETRNYRMAIIG